MPWWQGIHLTWSHILNFGINGDEWTSPRSSFTAVMHWIRGMVVSEPVWTSCQTWKFLPLLGVETRSPVITQSLYLPSCHCSFMYVSIRTVFSKKSQQRPCCSKHKLLTQILVPSLHMHTVRSYSFRLASKLLLNRHSKSYVSSCNV
jgi:hypothetical protein